MEQGSSQWRAQALTLIAEQFAIPMDLLAELLDLERTVAEEVMSEFAQRRWVRIEQFFVNDEPWVWLRRAGARECGTRFTAMAPNLRLLPHHRGVSEARLDLERTYPEGQWVCERRFWRAERSRDVAPDGIFRMSDGNGGIKNWAIEVELNPKRKQAYDRIIAQRRARYDRVIYYCPEQVAPRLEQVPAMSHVKVFVSGSLRVSADAERFQWKVAEVASVPPRRPVEPSEAAWVRLLAEQTAMPIDQFARFIGQPVVKARRIANRLAAAGFIRQGFGPVGDGPWLWPTQVGMKVAGVKRRAKTPSVLQAGQLRSFNEARLFLRDRYPDAEWRSAHTFGKGRGTAGPAGLLVSGRREAVVHVEAKGGRRNQMRMKYRHRYLRHQREGRHVLVVCAPSVTERLLQLRRRHGWEDLSVEECDALRLSRRKNNAHQANRTKRKGGDDEPTIQ